MGESRLWATVVSCRCHLVAVHTAIGSVHRKDSTRFGDVAGQAFWTTLEQGENGYEHDPR